MDIHVNSVKTYMAEIAKYPLVSREEEYELAEQIAAGSEEARKKLAEGNLRLVVKIACDFKSFGIPVADLIAEGNVGLLKAVSKFKPGKGAKFSSYAAWWIKQAIRRSIASQSKIIRVPVQAKAKFKLIKKTATDLKAELDRNPTEKEIAKALGMTERSIRSTLATVNSTISYLDAELTHGETGTVGSLIKDEKAKAPDKIMQINDVLSLLEGVVNKHLNDREIAILRLRYGFEDGIPKTLEEVSIILGRTRERIRQIQHQALKKIKSNIVGSEVSSMMSYAYSDKLG